jgi:hypothetical protein
VIAEPNQSPALESRLDPETIAIVVRAGRAETAGLDVRVDLDARVLRRGLHGRLPLCQRQQPGVVIAEPNQSPALESRLDPEAIAIVVRAGRAETAGLDVRVDLDAGVLRRRLHGGLPFGFASLVFGWSPCEARASSRNDVARSHSHFARILPPRPVRFHHECRL